MCNEAGTGNITKENKLVLAIPETGLCSKIKKTIDSTLFSSSRVYNIFDRNIELRCIFASRIFYFLRTTVKRVWQSVDEIFPRHRRIDLMRFFSFLYVVTFFAWNDAFAFVRDFHCILSLVILLENGFVPFRVPSRDNHASKRRNFRSSFGDDSNFFAN